MLQYDDTSPVVKEDDDEMDLASDVDLRIIEVVETTPIMTQA